MEFPVMAVSYTHLDVYKRQRTFYAKGQTGQQLLLGAYSSLSRMVEAGKVKLFTRYEMEMCIRDRSFHGRKLPLCG